MNKYYGSISKLGKLMENNPDMFNTDTNNNNNNIKTQEKIREEEKYSI